MLRFYYDMCISAIFFFFFGLIFYFAFSLIDPVGVDNRLILMGLECF